MATRINALQSSVERLTDLVRPLDDAAIAKKAYPAEWTIADVLSHLGSGAVIMQRSLEDALSGASKPDDFNQGVWDEWNAKSPREKVDDARGADQALMAGLQAVGAEERARFKSSLGPFELDWEAFVGLRLNEHVLHGWDVAVALDPGAPLTPDGTAAVVDNLDLISRFAAKPSGDPQTIMIATTDPERSFAVTIDVGAAAFAPAALTGNPDVAMPAESLIRLVYGRLDPQHTPSTVTGEPAKLDQLRAVFPGF